MKADFSPQEGRHPRPFSEWELERINALAMTLPLGDFYIALKNCQDDPRYQRVIQTALEQRRRNR